MKNIDRVAVGEMQRLGDLVSGAVGKFPSTDAPYVTEGVRSLPVVERGWPPFISPAGDRTAGVDRPDEAAAPFGVARHGGDRLPHVIAGMCSVRRGAAEPPNARVGRVTPESPAASPP